jgi:ketosteroid isomerase-like protein
MRMLKVGTAVLFFLALVACSRSQRARPDPEQLKQADLAFARATAERGLEGFSSFLSEDVMSIRPNTPVVEGSKALAGRWAPMLNDPATSITWQPLEAVISDDGDMGFTVGSYEVAKSGPQGRSVAGTGKYITIWKKQPDGAWKVVFDSGVQDAPPAEAPQ